MSNGQCFDITVNKAFNYPYEIPKDCGDRKKFKEMKLSSTIPPIIHPSKRSYFYPYSALGYGAHEYTEVVPFGSNDISLTKMKFNYDEHTPFEQYDCKPGDEILIIGHPHEIEGNVFVSTNDGIIREEQANEFLYREKLTVIRGKVKQNHCDEENHYLLHFKGIIWAGFSGGPIVLERDPLKLCGMVSTTKYEIRNDIKVYVHDGICSNHPMIKDALDLSSVEVK